MFVHTLPSGPLETNAYLIACPQTLHAAIVDPAPNSANEIIRLIQQNNYKPDRLLLTHTHWDHTADAAPLIKKYGIKAYVHPEDAPNLQSPGADQIPCWLPIEGIKEYVPIHEGDIIPVGNLQFRVIETPGHTPGGVCFYEPKEGILFSGDTLFKGTIGNISFSTGRPKLMWVSLQKLAKLPPETKVYPGHGPSTTIGQESWLPQAEKLFG